VGEKCYKSLSIILLLLVTGEVNRNYYYKLVLSLLCPWPVLTYYLKRLKSKDLPRAAELLF